MFDGVGFLTEIEPLVSSHGCQFVLGVKSIVRQGVEKLRLLDGLTKRRVSEQAVIEKPIVNLRAYDSMASSPNLANKIWSVVEERALMWNIIWEIHALLKNLPMTVFQVTSPNLCAICESWEHQKSWRGGTLITRCASVWTASVIGVRSPQSSQFLPNGASTWQTFILQIHTGTCCSYTDIECSQLKFGTPQMCTTSRPCLCLAGWWIPKMVKLWFASACLRRSWEGNTAAT